MGQKVLITGASGLIGTRLTDQLLQKGYQVVHLGRQSRQQPVPCFTWDIRKGYVDPLALQEVTTIIHLAGAGIADKRWSVERKREILESRTLSTKLLFETLNTTRHHVKNFVAASAIGYYGFAGSDHFLEESHPPGNDFLASVVKAWEAEQDVIGKLGIRLVKIRIGIVLSAEGGALKELARPIRWGVGAPLGRGDQYMSWIHVDDLCALFVFAIENHSMQGAYNAVAPAPVTNKVFTQKVAKQLKMPLLLPSVPGFVMKALVGEMADLVLNGSKISAARTQAAGFQFRFPDLEGALGNLLGKKD